MGDVLDVAICFPSPESVLPVRMWVKTSNGWEPRTYVSPGHNTETPTEQQVKNVDAGTRIVKQDQEMAQQMVGTIKDAKIPWCGEAPDTTPAAKNLRLTLRRHAERHVAKLVVLEADYCMAKKNKRRRKLQWDMNEAITRLHEIDELTPIWTLLNGEAGAV